jgi:hypothetical protein
MPPVGFEFTISEGERAQTYALERAATGTGEIFINFFKSEIKLKLIRMQPKFGARGGAVVKALCYKPAGCGFNSRWCHWNFQ